MPIAEDYRLKTAERLRLATPKIVHFPSSMAAAIEPSCGRHEAHLVPRYGEAIAAMENVDLASGVWPPSLPFTTGRYRRPFSSRTCCCCRWMSLAARG